MREEEEKQERRELRWQSWVKRVRGYDAIAVEEGVMCNVPEKRGKKIGKQRSVRERELHRQPDRVHEQEAAAKADEERRIWNVFVC